VKISTGITGRIAGMIVATALLFVGACFVGLGISFFPVIGIFVCILILWLAWRFLTLKPIALDERISGSLVPSNVMFHPGHAWARVEENDFVIVTVGMDDFAVKLLGSADSIALPRLGSLVNQGSPGWLLNTNSRWIRMLSPVDGEVVAVNRALGESPGTAFEDPYGNGWLFKVRSKNLTSNLQNMVPKRKVGEWFEDIRDNLASKRLAPASAPLYADGGEPVPGIAKAVDPERWDDLAGEFLLTWPPRKLDHPQR
jgi:glycine cleavage system H lipoate-binding protein